jgi:formylglycine-generating enzyme required for sulfatase activity
VSLPAGFAIDATEVTRAQYAAWLATSPSTNGQANVCSWNASFTPDATCMATVSVCQGAECAQHPQPCVDMCDAAAYCTAVGKRLCGAIGGGPVSSTAVDLSIDIASKSQWYNACTSNGVNQFTYGDSAVWGNCNDYLSFSKTTVPVASMPECQSPIPGYAGVFDLIGNVSEWEDNCFGSAGQADMCTPRGFSFGAGAAMPMCRQYTYANRAAAYATIGFRCCVP